MIIVIDYDAGNIANVLRALEKIGVTAELSADKEKILAADGLILPGVGAYPTAMAELERRGLVVVFYLSSTMSSSLMRWVPTNRLQTFLIKLPIRSMIFTQAQLS